MGSIPVVSAGREHLFEGENDLWLLDVGNSQLRRLTTMRMPKIIQLFRRPGSVWPLGERPIYLRWRCDRVQSSSLPATAAT